MLSPYYSCAVSFVAKRRKLEKAVPSGNATSSTSPTKAKRVGVSRRVQGRLQNMLTLPFDVLFLVCLPQTKWRSRQLLNTGHLSDICRTGTHGPYQPSPH